MAIVILPTISVSHPIMKLKKRPYACFENSYIPPAEGNIPHNSAKHIEIYIENKDITTHEIIDAGPPIEKPIAGRKNIPVPIIEFIIINNSIG